MLGTVEEELKKSRRDSAFQGIGIYSALKNIGKWRTDFYSLGLSESDVEKLYGVFIEIDSMKQGRVPFSLLWDWFVVECTMFCFLFESSGDAFVMFCLCFCSATAARRRVLSMLRHDVFCFVPGPNNKTKQ